MQNLKPVLTSVCFILVVLGGVSTHAGGAQLNPVAKAAQEAEPAATEQTPTKESPAEDLAPKKGDDAEFKDEFDFPEGEASVSPVRVADPLAPINRVTFQVNDKLYFWLLKPAAQGYNFVIPKDFRLCVSNFFSNVLTPVRLANCLLQGKFKNAGTEVARFLVNTTFGILGFGDPGKVVFNMDISDEDLGQTLGRWGFGNGFYIVWPVVGPSTIRESVGFFGDLWVNPIGYLEPAAAAVGVGAYRRFNDLSFRLGEYEAVKAAAIEPYTAVRDGYIQFRNSLVDK
jgi:phospholipid-binding lipoprotein MlaA